MVTGHAAGSLAALAAIDGCDMDAVEIGRLQQVLRDQQAILDRQAA